MAISDELTRIQTAKADIKASIEAKGVTVPSDALIDEYADYVDEISGGGQAEQELKDLIEGDIVTLNIPNGTTKIKEYFQYKNLSLTTLTIPNSVTLIDDYTFMNCSSLTNVTIGNGVNEVKMNAFWACSSLPKEDNISYAGDCAVIVNGNQTSYAIKDGTRLLKDGLFYYNSTITSITLPNSLIIIPLNAFGGCSSLTSINIPNSVTTIGQSAFLKCSITSVTIPNTVTTIGQSAFQNCSSLTSITILATTPPTLGLNVFNNTNDCPIYVPAESVEAYKAATNWVTYASRIQAIPSE